MSFFIKNVSFLKILKNPWNFNFCKNNVLIFEVLINSSKLDIKNAIEFIFDIIVFKVNTLVEKKFFYKNKILFKIKLKKKAFIHYY